MSILFTRPARLLRLSLVALVVLLLNGCSTTPQTRALLDSDNPGIARQAELAAVPFYPQQQYQCGPAALATVLGYSAVAVTPDELVSRVYVPGRQGSFQVEMLAATRQHQRLAHTIDPTLEALLASVAAGQPVLILQNLGLDWYPQWHYAVVIGYDLDRRQILLRSGETRRYVMGMKLFERTWRRADFWGMVALAPGDLPVSGSARSYFLSAAAFERSVPPEMASHAWQAGLARWPDNTELLMGYGNFLHGQGDFTAAVAQFVAVTERAPHYGPGYNNLAQSLMAAERHDEALVAASKAVSIGGELEAVYRETLRRVERSSQPD